MPPAPIVDASRNGPSARPASEGASLTRDAPSRALFLTAIRELGRSTRYGT